MTLKNYLRNTVLKNHLTPFTLNIKVKPLHKNSTAGLQLYFHISKHLTPLLKKFVTHKLFKPVDAMIWKKDSAIWHKQKTMKYDKENIENHDQRCGPSAVKPRITKSNLL